MRVAPGRAAVRAAAAVAAFAATALAPAAGRALTLSPLSLAELTAAAPIVVRARCEERQARRVGDGADTLARFSVLERVKGDPPDEVVVRELGGRAGAVEVTVPGAPASEPGDEALLFLAPAASGELEVVGIAHGYLPVVAMPGGGPVVRLPSRLAAELGGGATRPLATVLARVRELASRGAP
ncbi:MAG TPA: hypothetical protein VFD92_19535 [Candidatus Binatia bacterium]|nr:hypothetical protein [Candidatus Binatia bacterium]